jgi:hypothetical protein
MFQDSTLEMQDGQTEAERQSLISAEGSSQARRGLLLSSLKLTMQHPLLGVGPGQFAPYMAAQAGASGVHAFWVGTHNTYTQLSHASFLAYCVCPLFNHMAYEMAMPLMAAITVAMRRAVPDELSRLEDAKRRPEGAPESFLPVFPNRSLSVAG